ncbi:FUSC family membrane protein [Myroides odoratimimus]|uniref:FUSC family protein n=1 Tax=Myroides odoratimimus TaxID=76832 RepID=UPI002DB6EFAE|nr:FUSC family membrane protein [Myroides odoratimimus]MEC4051870.1 FUSC family membrane protein [Myroides odoratimimus]
MLGKARKFTDNTHLADSLKITISAVVPFLILMPYEAFDWAFAAAIGAMLTAPVDIPSNKKDKIIGLLVGAFTVPAVTFTLSITDGNWYFYPIFVFVFFSLSMISVYGHRANMLSFTGLLAASLGLAHSYEGHALFMHCLMLLLGGLLYLLVSVTFNLLRPKRYAVLQTSECMELTADYLKHRGQLWDKNANVEKITEEQLNIQVSLNEVHENLREYLVRNKANTGNSSNNRRLLVAFSTLVEILEVAVSTSFEHSKLHELFSKRPEIIECYQKLAYHFAETIDDIAYSINLGIKYKSKYDLSKELAEIQAMLNDFVKNGESTNMVEAVVMFSNVIHYAENQVNKIHDLEKALTEKAFSADVEERFKDLEKFLTPVHYRLETLKENLNFTSTIFRHALRLTLTILAGLIVSKISGVLNGYWILLTIVVIMRPGFGLTKQRSFERVIGTVIGGLVAIGLLYIIPSATVIAYITVLTMIIGYWFSHTDYKVGVTFITMYVVLIYGLLTPDFMDVMIYRVIDTIIGALLAFGANYLLWPSWEFLNLNTHLKKSIEANKEYVKEITLYYNEKGEVTLPYKLARKYAFIEIGNLMASFQRMIQEPKSKQKYRTELYELAVLNHTFLSTAASIGIYVQSHTTTKASEAFNVVMDYTIGNLKQTIALLEDYNNGEITIIERSENFNLSMSYLKGIREYELKKTYSDDKQIQSLMEESVLVIEQLMWLSSLSEKIFKITASIAALKKQEESEVSMLSSLRKKIIP